MHSRSSALADDRSFHAEWSPAMSSTMPSPGDPGSQNPPSAPAYGAPVSGAPVPPKKSRKGLWIGLGGCCGLALIAVIVLIIAAALSGGGSSPDAGTTDSSTTSEATTEDAAVAEEAPAEEDSAEEEAPAEEAPAADSEILIEISEVERATEIGDQYLESQAQGEYVIVKYSFANNSDEAIDLMSDELTLIGADGTQYSETTDGVMAFPDEYAVYETVNPGNSFSGVVVFDVPAGTEVTTLRYEPLLSFDDPIEVPLP